MIIMIPMIMIVMILMIIMILIVQCLEGEWHLEQPCLAFETLH